MLEKRLREAIEELGGAVFPKLDWSAPRDAGFLRAGSLKCETPGDIFLLLKGSDFVAHDLTHAFDACVDEPVKLYGGAAAEGSAAVATTISADSSRLDTSTGSTLVTDAWAGATKAVSSSSLS